NAAIGIDLQTMGGFNAPDWQCGVSHLSAGGGVGIIFPSLREAVSAWNDLPPGKTGVIVIMDSLSDLDASAQGDAPVEIEIAEHSRLLIVAGLWPLEPIPGAPPGSYARQRGHFDARQTRGHFVGNLAIRGTAPDERKAGACFINGLLIEGEL